MFYINSQISNQIEVGLDTELEHSEMKKVITLVMILVVLSTASYAMIGSSFAKTMGTVKEIVGLKCPNHDYVRDNHNFMYESIGGNPSTNGTRCLRCGYTKSLHKPQK